MSLLRLASFSAALLLASACAEGAQGPGSAASSGAGQGGNPSSGGGGPGGSGDGGDPVGGGGKGTGGEPATTSNTGSGGDGGTGDGGASTTASTSSGSSTATSTASSSSVSSSSGGPDPGTIYFSEYIEGEGNNKALEIYNAGSTSIDLGNCHLEFYQNGAEGAQNDVPLEESMLGAHEVFVICQSNFDSPGKCDRLTADVQHNGNDAIALVCDGDTKDIFGRIGEDDTWGSGLTSSEDSTLRRKCSVQEGDTNGSDFFDPADEWDGEGLDIFDDLGEYDCP